MGRNWTDYSRDLKDGLTYESFVFETLCKSGFIEHEKAHLMFGSNPERELSIEVKHDRLWRGTGNLYIELKERSVNCDAIGGKGMNWHSCGIMDDSNPIFYAIGDYERIFVLSCAALKSLSAQIGEDGFCKRCCFTYNNTETSYGFILCLKHMERTKVFEWDSCKQPKFGTV